MTPLNTDAVGYQKRNALVRKSLLLINQKCFHSIFSIFVADQHKETFLRANDKVTSFFIYKKIRKIFIFKVFKLAERNEQEARLDSMKLRFKGSLFFSYCGTNKFEISVPIKLMILFN